MLIIYNSAYHYWVYSIEYDTYDILPKGANADLISSVVISGLKSPTNTWKWSEIKAFGNQILKEPATNKPFSGNTKGRKTLFKLVALPG